jgi:hypothetical protein
MDSLVEILESGEFKKHVKNVVQPLGTMLYNELYIYIWFICIYNVFLIFLVVTNFILVIHIFKRTAAIPTQLS